MNNFTQAMKRLSMRSPDHFTKKTMFFTLMIIHATVQANSLLIGNLENGDLSDWQEKIFNNKTIYRIVDLKGKRAIKAISNNSASGLYHETKIDLEKTPYLNWSWMIEDTLRNKNEQSKQGDDFPARIYIIFSGGIFFWRTHALDYVWSSHQQTGSHWPNPYTSNTHMIAVESGNRRAGTWINEKRNIREDYKKYFGAEISTADAVAIMVDTDNTGQKAISYFGTISFSAE